MAIVSLNWRGSVPSVDPKMCNYTSWFIHYTVEVAVFDDAMDHPT